ncbi:MAG TPA: ATP-dependent helicase, partial [Nocardioidaceae bacterium]|nr:ATP-dependent helicase [Nocardioidaceae bacterium]
GRAGATGIAVTLVDWADVTRWKLINKALDLPFDDLVETYSTSPNLFHDMGIAPGVTGRLTPPQPAARNERPPPRSRGAGDGGGGTSGDGGGDRNRNRSRRRTRRGQPVEPGPAVADAATESTGTDTDERPSGQRRRRRRRRTSSSAPRSAETSPSAGNG